MTVLAFRKTLNQTTAFCVVAAMGVGAIASAPAHASESSAFSAPPNARAGECFARIMIPAQYKTQYKNVVVEEGGQRIEVSDARFAAQNEQILIRDAGVRYAVRQPIYKAVHERVMVRPGYERLAVEQAQYRTVSEEVQVAPARTAWKPGKSLADWSGVKATKQNGSEVYCLVEIPPETRTVTKRIQIRPQNVQTIQAPPIYRTITRHVLVDPGGVQEIALPAQYANIARQRLVQRAGHHSVAIAPRMKRIAYRTLVAPERYEWVRVLCKTNATTEAITGVQSQLKSLGYYQGALDGHLDLPTENAVRQYQREVGIPHGGYLSLDTIHALEEGRQAPVAASASAEAHATASASVAVQNDQSYGNYLTPLPSGEIPADILPEYQHHAGQRLTSTRRLYWPGKTGQ